MQRKQKADFSRPIVKYKEKQQMTMTLQSNLQCVLLALLSKHCSIVIGRPHRKCFITQQFIKVKQLRFGNDIIDVQNYIKNRSHELMVEQNRKGISEKTAKRRCQIIKRQEVMNLLVDILFHFGVIVSVSKEGVFDGRIDIYLNKTRVADKKCVECVGKMLNSYICDSLGNTKQIVLEPGNLERVMKDKLVSVRQFKAHPTE